MSELGAYPVIVGAETDVKLETGHESPKNSPSDGRSSNFVGFTERVKNKFIPEAEDKIHCAGHQFLDCAQNEFREIKTVDVDFRLKDYALASELKTQFQFTNTSPVESMLRNEEDIKQEVTAQDIPLLVDNPLDSKCDQDLLQAVGKCGETNRNRGIKSEKNRDVSAAENQWDCRLQKKLTTTAEKCREAARNILNGLDPEVSICSSLTDFVPVRNSILGTCYSDQPEQSRIYYDTSRIKLMDISVALEDLFEKIPRGDPSRPVQRHIHSIHCLCVFCSGKFRFPTRIQNPVQIFVKENTGQPVVKKRKRGSLFHSDQESVTDSNPVESKTKVYPTNEEMLKPFPSKKADFDESFRQESQSKSDKKLVADDDATKSEQKACPTNFSNVRILKLFSCEKCISAFKTQIKLEQHAVIHLKKGPFVCVYCDKTFKVKRQLQQHLIVHSTVKPFACSQCDRTFKRSNGVILHFNRVHSGARPFSCAHCGAAFKTKSDLKTHLVIHLTVKPILCPHCDAKFKSACKLKLHSVIHSDEKPFSCKECATKFKRSQDVQRHTTACHSDERPYSCANCGRSFKRRAHLRRHTESFHSNKKPFFCSNCAAKFKYRHSLKRHLRLAH